MSQARIEPYLNFDGNCEEAMNFYKSVLGGDLEITRFGEFDGAGMPVADDQKNKVMHSTLTSGSLTFMASDGMPGRKVNFGDSVSLSIAGPSSELDQLTKYFDDLSAGGKVTVPFAKAPWGDSFGMLTDKFGINWLVNCGDSTATSKD